MRSESKVQKSIIDYMEDNGWYVVRLIVTNKNGIPDLICVKPDVSIFIEVKKETGGVVSPLQRYRMSELKSLGFKSIVADCLSDVIEFLKTV